MIGVIGLGRMGNGIAATLLRKKFKVMVYDIDLARVTVLANEGAAAGTNIPQVCAKCDTILLSLPSSQVAVDVMEHDVLPAARPGTTVIDMGTTLVRETQRLHGLMQAREVNLIDAPVSGGTGGAAKGELYIFVGCNKAAAEREWKLLQALGGGRLTYCGESGCGQVTKAVNQLAMGIVDAAYIEAVAFGVNAGVDTGTLKEAVGGEEGFRQHFARIAGRIADGEGDAMDAKYAEYAYFLDEANRKDFPAPILDALYSFLRQFPASARDNMNRPYPPLWSVLTGATGGAARADGVDS